MESEGCHRDFGWILTGLLLDFKPAGNLRERCGKGAGNPRESLLGDGKKVAFLYLCG